MGLPAEDRAGKLRAVYFASLDLAWFGEHATRAKLPPGATISIVDGAGTVLSHYPDAEKWTGTSRDAGFLRALRAGAAVTFVHTGLDGAARLYAAGPLTRVALPAPAYLVVGLPRDDALADLRDARTRTLVALALLVAWFASARVLRQPVHALTTAARRLSQGDLATRTGLVRERGELARAFDEMANQLQVRNVEFRRALDELRESEERFRALVETTSDWIWEVDARGVYTYASPKVRELLGYAPEEIVGRTPFDLMPPDEAERIRRAFDDIVATQRPFERLENVNRHKDGRAVVLETSGVPLFDRAGRLAENAPDAIYRLRLVPTRGFEYVNPAVTAITGYAADECRRDPDFHLRLIHPEDRAKFEALLETPERLAKPLTLRWQHKDGYTVWIEHRSIPVRNEAGELVAIEGIVRDVSESVVAEAAMHRAHEMLDKIFGTTHFLMVYLDRDFNILRVNRAFAELTGHDQDHFAGHNLFALYPNE